MPDGSTCRGLVWAVGSHAFWLRGADGVDTLVWFQEAGPRSRLVARGDEWAREGAERILEGALES